MGVSRLKILHIALTGGWAGSERIAFALANNQAQNNESEVYIAVRTNHSYAKHFYQDQAGPNVHIIEVPTQYKGAEAIAEFLRNQLCSNSEFDIVHGHLGIGCRVAAYFGSYSYTLGHLHVRFMTTQHQNLDGVVAVSEWQIKDIPSWYKGDVVLVPNFLTSIPELHQNKKLAFKRKFYTEKDEFLFGIVSRLHIEKGIDLAIDAFNDLNLPKAKLIIIGEGTYLSYFKNLASNNPNIIFAGFLKNASEYMRLFDCMISPSRADSFGMSVLESLFCNVPIISSSTYGAIDILKNDPLLFTMDDKTDLKEKMTLAYNGMRNTTDFSRYHADISIPIIEDFYTRSLLKKRKILLTDF